MLFWREKEAVMFLLIDNYDSFTFNLVQAFQRQGQKPLVLRNDDDRILEIAQDSSVERVCISPGPGRPENAGLCLEFLSQLPHSVPVLGVCLGHQILGHFAGVTIRIAQQIMHGKTSSIHHKATGLFAHLPDPVEVGRYHSLVLDRQEAENNTLLEITARTSEKEIMGLVYTDRPWAGVQFHPESILTPQGETLLRNFS